VKTGPRRITCRPISLKQRPLPPSSNAVRVVSGWRWYFNLFPALISHTRAGCAAKSIDASALGSMLQTGFVQLSPSGATVEFISLRPSPLGKPLKCTQHTLRRINDVCHRSRTSGNIFHNGTSSGLIIPFRNHETAGQEGEGDAGIW